MQRKRDFLSCTALLAYFPFTLVFSRSALPLLSLRCPSRFSIRPFFRLFRVFDPLETVFREKPRRNNGDGMEKWISRMCFKHQTWQFSFFFVSFKYKNSFFFFFLSHSKSLIAIFSSSCWKFFNTPRE